MTYGMERVYLSFFLLQIVSTSSLMIAEDDAKNSALSLKSKRLTLRSYDPLTRRSALEKHFMRFGRSRASSNQNERFLQSADRAQSKHTNSIRKREAFDYSNENAPAPLPSSLAPAKERFARGRLTPSKVDPSVLCLAAEPDTNEPPAMCLDKGSSTAAAAAIGHNRSQHFYVVAEHPQVVEEGDGGGGGGGGDNNSIKNRTDNLVRYLRAHAHGEDGTGNLIRYRRSPFAKSMFSRYDRGRDNFLRLGRSISSSDEANKRRDGFMRLGRSQQTVYDRLSRRYDNFMRLGRSTDSGDRDRGDLDGYTYHRFPTKDVHVLQLGRSANRDHGRISRGHGAFLRLGRATEAFARSSRRSDSFMRLGRATPNGQYERAARRPGNFLRLGRGEREHEHEHRPLSSSNTHYADHIYDRFSRKADSFMRLGREPEDAVATNWVAETGDGASPATDAGQRRRSICKSDECEGTVVADGKGRERTPVGDGDREGPRAPRGQSSFMRLGRSRYACWAPPDTVQDLLDNRDDEIHANTSGGDYWASVLECLQKYGDNETSSREDGAAAAPLYRNADDDAVRSGAYVARQTFARTARRRGLLLRFGRSADSTANDHYATLPDSYQNSHSYDEETHTYKNLPPPPHFITEKTNKF